MSELVDAVAPPGSRFDAEQGAEISRSLQLRALLEEIVDTTPSARFASLEPPIIYIDDFLSAAECSSIIAVGTPGLRASAGAGKVQGDGKFQKLDGDFRSSSNAWCMGPCASDATVRSVEARIANLTGFPVANMEFLQILRRSTRRPCSRLACSHDLLALSKPCTLIDSKMQDMRTVKNTTHTLISSIIPPTPPGPACSHSSCF